VTHEIDEVTAWRAAGVERAIFMRGRTTGYAADPVGEYIIGVPTSVGYLLHRGRDRCSVPSGGLVVLDPTTAHRGLPLVDQPWTARLLVLELADVVDEDRLVDRVFPHPVVPDAGLARRFVEMHRASAADAPALVLQSGLAAFIDDLFGSPTNGHLDRMAVRRAATYLRDNVACNVSLDDLARTAGSSKFHLVRQFRAVAGVPPHTYQIGLRVLLARRLLEQRIGAAEVAARTGFTDQSHLHRHFRSRLGITPGRYAEAFRETTREPRTP
jgi:AraC-like DNA-binding protein